MCDIRLHENYFTLIYLCTIISHHFLNISICLSTRSSHQFLNISLLANLLMIEIIQLNFFFLIILSWSSYHSSLIPLTTKGDKGWKPSSPAMSHFPAKAVTPRAEASGQTIQHVLELKHCSYRELYEH